MNFLKRFFGPTVNPMSTQEAEKIVAEKGSDELLAMLARPRQWESHMLAAARAQLQKRGVEFSTAISRVHQEANPQPPSIRPTAVIQSQHEHDVLLSLELKLRQELRDTVPKLPAVSIATIQQHLETPYMRELGGWDTVVRGSYEQVADYIWEACKWTASCQRMPENEIQLDDEHRTFHPP